MESSGYRDLSVYYGDLHCHCNIGYGHGTVEDTFENARSQLDFASVTAHAHWPDIPERDGPLDAVIDYHRKGFQNSARLWSHLQEVVESVQQDGHFVSFPSFEWHSMQHGDHNIYYKETANEIIRAATLGDMRVQLRHLARQGRQSFLIPHHIGYKKGFRGINWEDFTSEFSPVVEILSMHGLSESDEAPYPYLHVMGPRDSRSTMQYGLSMGNIFGVIGSSDHHSAHSGSYGNGRIAVWAEELTRDSLWEAIRARRTYALTGDQIALKFAVNGQPMGSILPATKERRIEVAVIGGGTLDYVELLRNNCPIHRWSPLECATCDITEPVKVLLEVGWGEKDIEVDWQVEFEIVSGELLSAEPRFRGRDVVAPQASEPERYVFSHWERMGNNRVRFRTRTWGNPTTVTPGTQGMCLEIRGQDNTQIHARINNLAVLVGLEDLRQGSEVGYLGDRYLAPAYCFHRAVSKSEYTSYASLFYQESGTQRDWYYVRVRQKNGQWAYSSPIWVDAR